MKHNKYELRGEDHGTLDTKRTASDVAIEKYSNSNLTPEEALFLATKDLAAERIEKEKMYKKLERYEDNVGEEAVKYGENEHFSAGLEGSATSIYVNAKEGDAEDIEVIRIPAQKLGEAALADK